MFEDILTVNRWTHAPFEDGSCGLDLEACQSNVQLEGLVVL